MGLPWRASRPTVSTSRAIHGHLVLTSPRSQEFSDKENWFCPTCGDGPYSSWNSFCQVCGTTHAASSFGVPLERGPLFFSSLSTSKAHDQQQYTSLASKKAEMRGTAHSAMTGPKALGKLAAPAAPTRSNAPGFGAPHDDSACGGTFHSPNEPDLEATTMPPVTSL